MSGCPGTDRSALTMTRPARSLGAPSHSAAGDAFTPAAQTMVRASIRSVPSGDAAVVAFGDAGAEPDLDAELLERPPCRFRQRGIERGAAARPGFDQKDTGRARIDASGNPSPMHAWPVRRWRPPSRRRSARRRRPRRSTAGGAPRDRSRSRRARTRAGCGGAGKWRRRWSSGPARRRPSRLPK